MTMLCYVFLLSHTLVAVALAGSSEENVPSYPPLCNPLCNTKELYYDPVTGNVTTIDLCPKLEGGCESGLAFCACCHECKGAPGDPCDYFKVDCNSDLVCRSEALNKDLKHITWEDHLAGFEGVCAFPQRHTKPEPLPPHPPVCSPCFMDESEEEENCPELPENCQAGYPFCGCCRTCRGKIGSSCDFFKVRCEEGLVCYSEELNQERSTVTWEDHRAGFSGECALPAATQKRFISLKQRAAYLLNRLQKSHN